MEAPQKPEEARDARARASRFLHDQIVQVAAKQAKYIIYYNAIARDI
jgi:hypothetical protein